MNFINATPSAALDSAAKPQKRLSEIEVLRATAILMVLMQHMPLNLLFWGSRVELFITQIGFWTGVDLFFAISGFVIARSLLPRLEGITDITLFVHEAMTFWIARAWRLLPSAWLWLTLPLPLCLFFNHSHAYGPLQANAEQFVAGVLDVMNFHVADIYGRDPSGTAFAQWSLSLEEQFYIVLPFAAFLFRRTLFIPMFIIAGIGFFVPWTPLVMMLRLWPVAMGVLLALWSRHQTYQDIAPTGLATNRWARYAVFAVGLICLNGVGDPEWHLVALPLGLIALICAGLVWVASYDRGYLWQPGLARRVMEAIAARSYSLYLVHIPVYFGAHEVWYRLHKTMMPSREQAIILVLAALVVLALVAEANHRLLEEPLRARGKILAENFHARMANPSR